MKLVHFFKNFSKTIFIGILLLLLSECITRLYSKSEASFDINWQVTNDDLNKYTILRKQPWNLVFDGHMHTTYSDGYLSPQQLIQYQIANGYNVIFPTDHNSVFGALQVKKHAIEYNKQHNTSLLVIPGLEYTCCRIHMNLVGIDSDNDVVPITKFPSNQELQRVIAVVHERGGLVIVNHLPWSLQQRGNRLQRVLQDHPTKEELLSWGVDGFEVVNQNVFDYPTYEFCMQHNLIAWAGSDLHWPSYPFAWNVLQSSNSPTQDDVLAALRKRKNTIILHPYPEHLYAVQESSHSSFWAPMDSINNIFKSMYMLDGGMYSFVDGTCHTTIFYLEFGVIFSWILWLLIVTLVFIWIDFIAITKSLYTAYRWMLNIIFTPQQDHQEQGEEEEEELVQQQLLSK